MRTVYCIVDGLMCLIDETKSPRSVVGARILHKRREKSRRNMLELHVRGQLPGPRHEIRLEAIARGTGVVEKLFNHDDAITWLERASIRNLDVIPPCHGCWRLSLRREDQKQRRQYDPTLHRMSLRLEHGPFHCGSTVTSTRPTAPSQTSTLFPLFVPSTVKEHSASPLGSQ